MSRGEDWYDGEQFELGLVLGLGDPFRPTPSLIPDPLDFPVKFSLAV